MKNGIWFCFLLLPLLALSQEEGIHFAHGLNWQQVKEKARAERKYIFIDCYATWCGPCKMMARTVFPQKTAGDYYNEKFINIKLQLDTTDNDNEEVKSWYADGKAISDQGEVKAFPTLLFYNPDGILVHRISGAASTPDELIALGEDAMDSTKQYFTLKGKYKSGDRNPEFLLQVTRMLMNVGDTKTAAYMFGQYVNADKNMPMNEENVGLLSAFAKQSQDSAFIVLINNYDKISNERAKQIANRSIIRIVGSEEIVEKTFSQKKAKSVNWDSLQNAIAAKYPMLPKTLIDELLSEGRFNFYRFAGDKKKYGAAIVQHIKIYGTNASPETLNNAAWDVFQTCNDPEILQAAIGWSKRYQDTTSNAAFIDTYANLLYKTGNKKEALAYETKALSLAPQIEKKTYQQTLDKMKKGIKTWD